MSSSDEMEENESDGSSSSSSPEETEPDVAVSPHIDIEDTSKGSNDTDVEEVTSSRDFLRLLGTTYRPIAFSESDTVLRLDFEQMYSNHYTERPGLWPRLSCLQNATRFRYRLPSPALARFQYFCCFAVLGVPVIAGLLFAGIGTGACFGANAPSGVCYAFLGSGLGLALLALALAPLLWFGHCMDKAYGSCCGTGKVLLGSANGVPDAVLRFDFSKREVQFVHHEGSSVTHVVLGERKVSRRGFVLPFGSIVGFSWKTVEFVDVNTKTKDVREWESAFRCHFDPAKVSGGSTVDELCKLGSGVRSWETGAWKANLKSVCCAAVGCEVMPDDEVTRKRYVEVWSNPY